MAHPFRVLIVETHRDITNLLRAFFERRGCAVVAALDGRTALEVARPWRPDLVLVDLESANVGDLVPQLMARPDAWPDFVVALTGASEENDRAAKVGVQTFLRKPIEFERLDDLLTEMQRSRRRCA